MKKIVLLMTMLLSSALYAIAADIPGCKYDIVDNNDKIKFNKSTNSWSKKINKKTDNYYIKVKDFGSNYGYLNPDKTYAFVTDCDLEFLYGGRLIGHNSQNLKFYDLSLEGDKVLKTELTKEEVKSLFPDYKVICISDFSKNTNSIKFKKGWGDVKVLILNDTEKEFNNYKFTSGNSKFETYPVSGFLTISQKGMIQFSGSGSHFTQNDWYVLLVR